MCFDDLISKAVQGGSSFVVQIEEYVGSESGGDGGGGGIPRTAIQR